MATLGPGSEGQGRGLSSCKGCEAGAGLMPEGREEIQIEGSNCI